MWDNNTLAGIAKVVPSVKRPPPGTIVEAPASVLAAKENARLTPQISNPSAASFDQALSNLSAHAQNLSRSLEFSVDRESGDTVVKVVDSDTKEVIRQIPSEEVLAIAHRLQAGYGGLLKEKA